MRKSLTWIMLALLAGLCAVIVVSAQEATVEPTPEVTSEVSPTAESTSAVTEMPTAEITAEATAAATAQPTVGATAEVTSEVPVTAEATSVPAPSSSSGFLRVANFVPDAGNVDVYIANGQFFRNVPFPGMTQWLAFDPGTYTVSIAPSGQSSSSALSAPFEVIVSAGTWQTVAFVGSQNSGTVQAALIAEDYEDLLPATAGFTFFNAVEGSPAINLTRGEVVFFAQIGFPSADTSSSSSLRVDSGSFSVSAIDANDPNQHVFAQQSALDISENGYTFVALVGTTTDARLFVLTTRRAVVEMLTGTLTAPGSLLEALQSNENLTAFASALQSGGLSDLLTGTQKYTIFAPANFALDNTSMTAEEQANVLRSYIVEGDFASRDFINAGTLTALDGTQLNVTTNDNQIFVNGVQVIDLNIAATNGVIHMLNGQLNQPTS